MCGFIAVLGKTSRKELARALVPLAPRGPDDEGIHLEPGFGCAHRRLAIVGPDARGAQPFVRDDVVVVFNGCIYNYPALRRDFARQGMAFASRTDTEILPLAWRRWGEEMPRHLEGMFAFVLWDRRTKTLFAATDAFGAVTWVALAGGSGPRLDGPSGVGRSLRGKSGSSIASSVPAARPPQRSSSKVSGRLVPSDRASSAIFAGITGASSVAAWRSPSRAV